MQMEVGGRGDAAEAVVGGRPGDETGGFARGVGRYGVAAAGAALFAVAPTPWSMSLVARSYALNALLVGCVVFSLITWRETGRARWFCASCLFIGLSVVHHGTTYLLLPAYGLYLLLV